MKKSAILAADIKNFDMEAFARWAQLMVLEDILLVEAKIYRNPLIELPGALSLQHKCDTNYLWSEKNKIIDGKRLCNFQVAGVSPKSPDKIVMGIKASFCSSYSYDHKGTPPFEDDFGDWIEYSYRIVPLYDAWPYWREFVQNMSSRMGFPALTVPLLQIVPEKSVAKEVKSPPVKKKSTRRKKVNA
jgi:hypothetical protein